MPAFGKLCFHCGKPNHFQQCCRSKKNVNFINSNLSMNYNYIDSCDIDNENVCVFSLAAGSNEMHIDKWKLNLSILGHDYDFMIDKLAQCTVIPYHIYTHFHNKLHMHTSTITISGFGGSIVKPLGYIILPVVYKKQSYRIRYEVVSNNIAKFYILSDVDSIKLGLIKRIMSLAKSEVPESTKLVMNKYNKVFHGIGKLPGTYELKIRQDAIPVASFARPIPVALREATKRKLGELEQLDRIQKIPVNAPYEWRSNLHIVPKKN